MQMMPKSPLLDQLVHRPDGRIQSSLQPMRHRVCVINKFTTRRRLQIKFTVLQHSILENQYAALLYIEPSFRNSFTMTSYIRHSYAEKYVIFAILHTHLSHCAGVADGSPELVINFPGVKFQNESGCFM